MSEIETFASLINCNFFEYMIENDIEFRTFVEENKNKTTESIVRDYNLDFEILKYLV